METTNSGYFAYCSIHVHFYSYKGFFLPCNSSFTLKPWFCDEIFSLLGFQASEKKGAIQNKRDAMLELYRLFH